MKTVAILGFGRFGELFANLLKNTFSVSIVEQDSQRRAVAENQGYELCELQAVGNFDIVIFAVPISSFEEAVISVKDLVKDSQLIIDICSVKVYPATIMKKHLPNCQILATHPMFGPDSASKGLAGLQVAICPVTASEENVEMVVSFWNNLGVETIVTTVEAHDKDSVYSQAFTYSIAKIILGMKLEDVRLKTRSFNALDEVARLSANDSEQLFHDMLYYNPYFADMKHRLANSIEIAMSKLNDIEQEQEAAKLF